MTDTVEKPEDSEVGREKHEEERETERQRRQRERKQI